MDERGGKDQGIQMAGYLIAGVLFYGGIGWLADTLLGTSWWLPIGLLVGVGLAVYLIIKRFGSRT